MGKVFQARHLHLDREFAIKFVAADISGHSEAQLRFEQETRALGQLQHPHIVNAVDAGCVNGLKYLVTELIDGEDLAQVVERRGPLPPVEACELIRQAALGLSYLHGLGFVHRDIKPSNLIVNRAGIVKLLDFGLVHGGTVDHQLTDAGETIGTWDFLAPEQAHDASQVDCRCDLYSLGGTLLYLLSGRPPFGDDKHVTPASKLKGHLFDTPAWLEHPPAAIPYKLIEVLRRLLAKSPDERFQTAAEVAEALTPFVSSWANSAQALPTPQLPSARRKWILSSSLVLGVLCLIAGLAYFRPPASAAASESTPQSAAAVSAPSVATEEIEVSVEEFSPDGTVREIEDIKIRHTLTTPEAPTRKTVMPTQLKSAAPLRFPDLD